MRRAAALCQSKAGGSSMVSGLECRQRASIANETYAIVPRGAYKPTSVLNHETSDHLLSRC